MAMITTVPNVGNVNIVYGQCYSCSRMFMIQDDRGEEIDLPRQCRRCGCPLSSEKAAKEWMEKQAEIHHDPALAKLGERSRRAMTEEAV